MKRAVEPTPEMVALLRRTASSNESEARTAKYQLAKALELPLRKGVLSGDILDGIFEEVNLPPGTYPEFPLDLLAPGTEKDFVAFTMPNHGYVPQKVVESDYVMVPTYMVGNSIGWTYKYGRDARWDIVSRAMEVLEAGHTKKRNDDGAHVLLSAGVDRNIVVFDGDANAGQFTKRLVSLMKLVMRRNGGGNSTSLNRGKLTHLVMSPESEEDIRNWGVDQLDETSRREVYVAEDGKVNRIFGVTLVSWDELGEGQEYQNYFSDTLSGSLASGDVELFVGLDLQKNDSFYMPRVEAISLHQDPTMEREGMVGWWSREEFGIASLNNQRILLGSA